MESNKQFLLKEKVPVFGWTKYVPSIELSAMQQIANVAKLPFIHKHIAIMPDVHCGIGATIGSVIATKGAIIPASVGVDLGCGCFAIATNLTAEMLPDNLFDLRCKIEAAVPHGRTSSVGGSYDPANDRGLWGDAQPSAEAKLSERNMSARLQKVLAQQGDKLLDRAARGMPNQLGTLGTGNHFVEICLDERGSVWVMLHSGSRGIGNRIGTHFIEKARKMAERHLSNLPDKDLAFFPEETPEFTQYIEAMTWAQDFALANREVMAENVLSVLASEFPGMRTVNEAVNMHHNYAAMENHFGSNVWVTRKGAVRARTGDMIAIPGSMGAKSFIVRGKGNKESFCSCSHGAGRVMSRTEANRTITLEQHAADTAGVECRKDASVLDESPRAYKRIEDVMRSQDDLVDIVHTLKQILVVKG